MTTPLQLAHARAAALEAQATALEAQANELRRQAYRAIAAAQDWGPRVVTLAQYLGGA